MVTDQSIDIQALRQLISDVGGPQTLHAGCLQHSDSECQCPYIFDEGHAGGIGEVYIDNGLAVCDGGNDAPSRELARAYLRLIVGAVNALPALLDKIENGD